MRKAQKKVDTRLSALNRRAMNKLLIALNAATNLINFLVALAMVRFLEMISDQIEYFHKEDWVSENLPRDHSWVFWLLGLTGFIVTLFSLKSREKMISLHLILSYFILLLLAVSFWFFSLDWIKLSVFI